MPEITLEMLGINPAIQIEIPNVSFDGTEVKRLAQVQDQHYSPAMKRVTLDLLIIPFSKTADDKYGVALYDHPLFRNEQLTLVADNTTIVNQQGKILLRGIDESVTAAEIDALYGQPAREAAPEVLAEDGVTVVTPAVDAQPAGVLYDPALNGPIDWVRQGNAFRIKAKTEAVVVDQLIIDEVQQHYAQQS